ncbi:uncharacterized protein DS421_13g422110 [Arachis hypogaea]|nr:uncharacterized protein DS421_13g422110 [Arachis hypogaea]
MSLDETELAIAAYLYGDHLMDNYEEDIVFSEFTAHRDVFRSLMPGKPIISLVLDLVADMMRIELTRESGYWGCLGVCSSELSLRPLSEGSAILFSISPYTEWEDFEAVVKVSLPLGTCKSGSWLASGCLHGIGSSENCEFSIKAFVPSRSPQALVSCYGGNWTLVLVRISPVMATLLLFLVLAVRIQVLSQLQMLFLDPLHLFLLKF